ncbi:hypothetical protein GCK32_010985 [Trichostrongylus colubriformis]|uniref:Uncharacterized protein n=1 Tax=Trichostrongylus colubriformis TaxID=6319 RepID=A0AAN8G3E9_TRICO
MPKSQHNGAFDGKRKRMDCVQCCESASPIIPIGLMELERLIGIGAKVFHLEYISRYLLEEHVDETLCYHVDYKKFLLTRKT